MHITLKIVQLSMDPPLEMFIDLKKMQQEKTLLVRIADPGLYCIHIKVMLWQEIAL